MKKNISYFRLILIISIIFYYFSCDNSGNTDVNDNTSSIEFATAEIPGQKVTVNAGNTNFNMIYVNNQTSITFPYSPIYNSPSNSQKSTLTRKYFMGETHVTNALMAEVFQWAYNNGKFSTELTDHNGVDSTTAKYGDQQLINISISKINYNEGVFSVDTGFGNHPVVCVTWYGAVLFCNWLTEICDGNTNNIAYSGIDTDWFHDETSVDVDKTGYRLPASEEWEYGARYIGTTEPSAESLASEYIATGIRDGHVDLTPGYYWTPANYASGAIKNYSNETETREAGWYTGDTDMEGGDKLMPVALKKANQLGLYDMSGNVWEWSFTLDVGGLYRLWRGGSCWRNMYTENEMQVGLWYYNSPDYESNIMGFRLAKTQ